MQVVAGMLRAVDLPAFLLGGVAAELTNAAARLRPELVDEALLLRGRLAQQLKNLISEISIVCF